MKGTFPERVKLDVTRIAPRLWQGSAPLAANARAYARHFHAIVLCAYEYQPRELPPVRALVHAPLDDASADADTIATAASAARDVVRMMARGSRVLVTCAQGRNRSGLVVALALRELTGHDGERIVALIQSKRPAALTNREFAKYLRSLPTRRAARSQ